MGTGSPIQLIQITLVVSTAPKRLDGMCKRGLTHHQGGRFEWQRSWSVSRCR